MQYDSTARATRQQRSRNAVPKQPGPVLLPAAKRSPRHSPLVRWHLLSLDAPTVAAVWTYFVAVSSHVKLSWTTVASMFVAVWMLYAADRLLDARGDRPAGTSNLLEERHRFHGKYQRWFMSGIAGSAFVLAAMLGHATHKELQMYAALGALLFAYFFLIHLWPFTTRLGAAETQRLPKEFAVGIFFAAAVFIPTVSRVPSLQPGLLPVAFLFAGVCTLNCLYIYAWEHPDGRSAHWTTQVTLRRLSGITVCLAACCLLLSLQMVTLHSVLPVSAAAVPLACCMSTAGFFVLHKLRFRFTRTTLRAAVDLVLLTPMPFLLFPHLLT